MKSDKFCVDCMHFVHTGRNGKCLHPKNMIGPDLVYGYMTPAMSPDSQRHAPHGFCGQKGNGWEAKPKLRFYG